MGHTFRTLIGVAVIAILAASASLGDPAESYAQRLASDRYFVIGGHRIIVPTVALRGPGHVFDLNSQRSEKAASETNT